MFKFCWISHKWIGIIFSIIFLNTAISGYLLLVKKDYNWIQPPTQKGAEGKIEDFLTPQQLFNIVLSHNHIDFKSVEDIDRIDFRPGKRVHKVRSKQNYSEIQVCAVTGEILSVSSRNSDLLEALHDGSIFWGWGHDCLMPVLAFVTIFLVLSGLYLWLAPLVKKSRKKG